MATLSSDLLDRYSPETSALVWLEGKMLIPTFYTPKTLRIPPPASFNLVIDKVEDMQPTVLTCLLIENENSEQFMNIYPEFQTAAPISEEEEQPISEPTGADADADADADVVDEDDVVDLTIDDEPAIAPQVEEIDEFFVIGLKGKDNKRIEVKVSTETKIRSLLMHYLKVKGLDERTVDITHAKLIFDDEPLDMDAHVGDTELEEDFEIQIVL
ncbi:uncharacterized protein SPAPADRAFT_62785 [Spathaspora passalidarum NRRL Y-27907]|uniref:Rad60/SUMO-like domain-containing protein n=1 Tax=Spathaspora passalidarum (strain NRRL Y-27907 / 11-Y1) TaxID=619300 RepID=G3ATB9_SPAPN|nr:uncharacterized protein SPAPADRAFT_62785 [Spathaspora passalidarum NRRL Y-27907]EGW30882.1 hypothetical protein SPAPADRAFT_62785 [Spathaspora passalidarum NRRL Y-27907]